MFKVITNNKSPGVGAKVSDVVVICSASLRMAQRLHLSPCAHIIQSVVLIRHFVCVRDSQSETKYLATRIAIILSLGKTKEYDPASTDINRYLERLG